MIYIAPFFIYLIKLFCVCDSCLLGVRSIPPCCFLRGAPKLIFAYVKQAFVAYTYKFRLCCSCMYIIGLFCVCESCFFCIYVWFVICVASFFTSSNSFAYVIAASFAYDLSPPVAPVSSSPHPYLQWLYTIASYNEWLLRELWSIIQWLYYNDNMYNAF